MGATIHAQVDRRLNGLMRIGESKHEAKRELIRDAGKEGRKYDPTHDVLPGIYSMESRRTYQKSCDRFIDWCREERGVGNRSNFWGCEKYVDEYLTWREERGCSPYTLRTDRAALGKLYGHPFEHKIEHTREITRSRGEAVRDKDFNEDLHRDLVELARGTGGRRGDLEQLRVSSFVRDGEGRLYAHFEHSKGGRERWAYVLPEHEPEIVRLIDAARERGGEDALVMERVNGHADIHGYRRDYAKGLYREVERDGDLRAAIAGMNVSVIREIDQEKEPKSREYRLRDGSGEAYDREALRSVSYCLGHSRIDTAVAHYLGK